MTERSRALQATALIQSDHPLILAKAREIVANSKTRLAAVRALKNWVFRSLKKKSVVGIPSALETLQRKVGDCNEHATLFAALARAVRIPCRIVSGIAYLKGNFFYHAWNECEMGQAHWFTLDSTWNQLPADVTHIAFVRGGLDKQVVLLQLLGRLRIRLEP